MPTLNQELAWYADSVSVATVEGLRDVSIKKRREDFPLPKRPRFTVQEVEDLAAQLASVHYGVPHFASQLMNPEGGATQDVSVMSSAKVCFGILLSYLQVEKIDEAYKAALLQKKGLDKFGLHDENESDTDTVVDSDDHDEGTSAGKSPRKRGARDKNDDDDGAAKESPKKRLRSGKK